MTPANFVAKWKVSILTERAAAQAQFSDLCRMLDEPTPSEADPSGEWYAFEKGASKTTGAKGWADVWKRGHFAWEYKAKGRDLDAAFAQLQQYAGALGNPPLLVVSDMQRFRIHTAWTNTVSVVHEMMLDDLLDADKRRILKWVLSDPERLRPGLTRQALTEKAAATFATLALRLRGRGHDPQRVAHFVNRLVFCMFAEDVDLLPRNMFQRMLDAARIRPEDFEVHAGTLFAAMRGGGMVGFEAVEWFNGGLFDDDEALPLTREDVAEVLTAARLDWAEIDPSIFGTLFERGLDPDKRSQLGAHYTDRDKIMLIIEPVVSRPLLAEWEDRKAAIEAALAKADAARSPTGRTRARNEADVLYRAFLDRLRAFRVLDPEVAHLWPEAEAIIGNPPFLGDKMMIGVMGENYVNRLRRGYANWLPGGSDLVCYWFAIADRMIRAGRATRAGFVSTNSIRGGANRKVLDAIRDHHTITDAWADEEWTIEGAAVRVSLVCFAAKNTAGAGARLDGLPVTEVFSDLTGGAVDLTTAVPLPQNRKTAFNGVQKTGPFEIPGELARSWLKLPLNPNGRPNADVLKPYWNGIDLVRRPRNSWIIDFGPETALADACLYKAPMEYIRAIVEPVRRDNKIEWLRYNWWPHYTTLFLSGGILLHVWIARGGS